MKYTILSAALLFAIIITAPNAFSAAYTQSAAGESVVTGASGPGGALTFTPSPSVLMDGASNAQSFAVVAGHNSAVAKTDGKAFGMASDSQEVYYKTLTATTDVTSFSDSTSATFNTSWSTF